MGGSRDKSLLLIIESLLFLLTLRGEQLVNTLCFLSACMSLFFLQHRAEYNDHDITMMAASR